MSTTASQSSTASPASSLPPASSIIDDLSISGLGANPSGWYPLADTASLSASATDCMRMQEGMMGDGMYAHEFGSLDGVGSRIYQGQGIHQGFL